MVTRKIGFALLGVVMASLLFAGPVLAEEGAQSVSGVVSFVYDDDGNAVAAKIGEVLVSDDTAAELSDLEGSEVTATGSYETNEAGAKVFAIESVSVKE